MEFWVSFLVGFFVFSPSSRTSQSTFSLSLCPYSPSYSYFCSLISYFYSYCLVDWLCFCNWFYWPFKFHLIDDGFSIRLNVTIGIGLMRNFLISFTWIGTLIMLLELCVLLDCSGHFRMALLFDSFILVKNYFFERFSNILKDFGSIWKSSFFCGFWLILPTLFD